MLRDWLSRHRTIALVGLFVGMLTVETLVSLFIPVYGDICNQNEHTGHKDCAAYHIALVFWWHVGELLNYYSVAVTAVATGFIGYFTFRLKISTDSLATIAASQDQTSRKHERAYVIWGGWYGTERPDPAIDYRFEFIRRDPASYKPPWTMQIHNFGRTPGFVTKVQWGTYGDAKEFRRIVAGKKLSALINDGTLPTITVPNEIVVNPTLNGRPWPYRFVFATDRGEGTVNFGKIIYKDVFGECHHSTWAVEIEPKGVGTIGDVISNDWS